MKGTNIMSVDAYKRKESNVEFLNNFDKIRKNSYQILMRDFGIKKRQYSIHLIEEIYKLDENDQATLEQIMEKYKISSAAVDKYPEWIITTWRTDIAKLLTSIGIEIRVFNSVYISDKSLKIAEQEYLLRREHIAKAIGYLWALKDKFQEIIMIVDVSLGAYVAVNKKIDHEIKLLKGVRQADNKLFDKIKAKFD